MWMQDVTFMEFIQVFPLLGLIAYVVLVLMVISGIYRTASRRIRRDIIVEVLRMKMCESYCKMVYHYAITQSRRQRP